jgi:outer membrane receptor protein involved in Fe transport
MVATRAADAREEHVMAKGLSRAGRAGAFKSILRSGISAAALGAACYALPPAALGADAADQPTGDVQEVVVTGSHIARDTKDKLEPTVAVSGDFIQERGITNVAEALEQIPGVGFGATSLGGQNSFSLGQNFVNMFNLGSQRTLTLVNGRRFMPGQTPSYYSNDNPGVQVDLNTIPTDLIDHIEVISVGGASVYGADAVAGTVNIILKNNFEGYTGDVQFGRSGHGDANSYSARASAGVSTDDKRGNLIAAFEFNQEDGFLQSQRPLGYNEYGFVANPAAYVANPAPNTPATLYVSGIRTPYSNSNGVIFATNAPGTANMLQIPDPAHPGQMTYAQFGRGGNIVPYNPGFIYPDGNATGGQGTNWSTLTPGQVNLQRVNASLIGHYDLTDWATAYSEITYSHTGNNGPIGSWNYFNEVQDSYANNAVAIPSTNPFLSPQAKAVLAGQNLSTIYVSRDFPELMGFSQNTANQNLFNAVFGVKGDFPLFSRTAHYDTSVTIGGNYTSFDNPQLIQNNFNNAVDAVVGPAGQIVCRSTLANPGNGCVPLNLFGRGSVTDAMAAYLIHDDVSHNIMQQDVADANISLPVADLPAGPLHVATGFEYRRDYASFSPGPLQLAGIDAGASRVVPTYGIAGAYDSLEGYGEALIPVLSKDMGLPLVESLQFEGSFRRVKNSVEGYDNAWTGGGRYAPTGDLQFRGNVSRSIRAPAITELDLGRTENFQYISDPCSAENINSGPAPATRRANCLAMLQSVGYTASTPFISNVNTSSVPSFNSGNPGLKNERADSWTVGAVFTPSFLPRFTASADWVNIRVNAPITDLYSSQVLSECYDRPGAGNAACGLFKRYTAATAPNPGLIGGIDYVNATYLNTGYIRYDGLQTQAAYSFDLASLPLGLTDAGSLKIQGTLNYMDKYDTSVSGQAYDLVEWADTPGYPRISGQIDATYSYGDFRFLWQALYQDSVAYSNSMSPTQQNIQRLGSYWQHNATATYYIDDNISVHVICDNVFDAQPPYGANYQLAYGYYDVMGRYFKVGASAKF